METMNNENQTEKVSQSEESSTNETEPQNKGLWRQAIDPETQKPYYYHTLTKETTWEIPDELKTSNNQEINQKQESSEFVKQKEQNVNDFLSNKNPEILFTELLRLDPNVNKNDYFLEGNWNIEALRSNLKELMSKVLVQPFPDNQQTQNISTMDGSVFPPQTTNATPGIITGTSPLWCTAIDPSTRKMYYYNAITRQSQWEKPAELQQSQTNFSMPTTGDYAFHASASGRRRRRSMKEMQDAWDRGERAGLWECPDCSKILTEGSKKTHPDSCNARKARNIQMLPNAPPEVLAGIHWKSVKDPNSGFIYYYHQISKDTSWIKPQALINYEQYQQQQQQKSEMGSNGTFSQWNETTDASGRGYYNNDGNGASNWDNSSNYQGQNGGNMGSTVQNADSGVGEWIGTLDSSTGRQYYYNSVTKASSWTNPTLQPNQQQIPIHPSINDPTKEQVSTTNNPTHKRPHDEISGPNTSTDSPNKLQNTTHWKVAMDPNTGKNYYYNKLTKVRCWEKPPELKALEQKSFEYAAAAAAASVQSPILNDISMWKQATDPYSGKPYYYHIQTKETSWKLPDSFINSSQIENQGLLMNTETMTEEMKANALNEQNVRWIKVHDPNYNKFYWYHAMTKETTWDMPLNYNEEFQCELCNLQFDSLENTNKHNSDFHANKTETNISNSNETNEEKELKKTETESDIVKEKNDSKNDTETKTDLDQNIDNNNLRLEKDQMNDDLETGNENLDKKDDSTEINVKNNDENEGLETKDVISEKEGISENSETLKDEVSEKIVDTDTTNQ